MSDTEPRHAATPQPIAWFTPRVRLYTYGVLAAIVSLLISYGILDNQTAPLCLALATALLGFGTAGAHVPRGES